MQTLLYCEIRDFFMVKFLCICKYVKIAWSYKA